LGIKVQDFLIVCGDNTATVACDKSRMKMLPYEMPIKSHKICPVE